MSEERDERIIEAILAGGVKIPPMPGMLVELAALERDPDAGATQYAALIGRDPALAGAVFRVVGSPVFGLRAKVDNLAKAITVLGLRTTNAVVRGEAMRNALHDPNQMAAMNALWRRAQGIADVCVAIIRTARLRGISTDQAFLLGVFHDCGIAILCRRFPDYGLAFAAGEWPDLAALDQHFQTGHDVVGQMVARNWQLPADLALAVRHHHEPPQPGLPESATRLIALLRYAMRLHDRQADSDDPEWAPWQAPVMALLGRDAAGLEELRAELVKELETGSANR